MPHVDGMPLGHPCWIELATSDPAASRTFYERLFGWTSEVDEEFGGYTTFSLDGAKVAGAMGKDHMPDGGAGIPDDWAVYLHVADAAATLERAAAHGGTVVAGPEVLGDLGTMGFVVDPGGAAIGLWQPDQHTSFGVVAEPNAPGWFELHARDFAGAIAFYETVFGWTTSSTGDTDEFRYSTLEEGEKAAAGVMDGSGFLPEGEGEHWSVYFTVADTGTAVDRAVELGATLVQGPDPTPFGTLASLTDPTGVLFKLTDGSSTGA